MIISSFTKRTNLFDKKYSLLSPYILDINVRKNMIENKDLLRKYQENETLITTFVKEISKRFDNETINKIIIDTIFKFPDEVLVSFITAYLNSTEESKNNIDVVKFYNKILHHGPEVIKYVEKNGIVTNRECKELPRRITDERFKKLNSSNYTYGEYELKELYKELSYPERNLLIEFIETNNYKYLNMLFSPYMDLKQLMYLLKMSDVNTNIINKPNIEGLGVEAIQMISMVLFSLAGDINSKETNKAITTLMETRRYDLIMALINNNMLIYSHYIDLSNVEKMTEEEMIDSITMSRMILEKKTA